MVEVNRQCVIDASPNTRRRLEKDYNFYQSLYQKTKLKSFVSLSDIVLLYFEKMPLKIVGDREVPKPDAEADRDCLMQRGPQHIIVPENKKRPSD